MVDVFTVVIVFQMCERDREVLWAMVTFYGGSCQLNLNKRCTHLVTPSTEGVRLPVLPSVANICQMQNSTNRPWGTSHKLI